MTQTRIGPLVLLCACAASACAAFAADAPRPLLLAWNPVTGLLDYRATGQANLEAEADRLRDEAMSRFEHDDRKTAMALNKKALRVTRHLPETSWRTVENYDDAGLYFFDAGKWKSSAQNQAIAVLLACGTPESAQMFPTYVERLGWAFAKYRPREDFTPIAVNPLLLLKDTRLNVRANHDLRRRYFRTIRLKGAPASSTRYLYKLRPAAVPASCVAGGGATTTRSG
jgi:hypothetical protein